MLNVAAVKAQEAMGGWTVMVGDVKLPVWYPDAQTAGHVAGRLFEILQDGHEAEWERYLAVLAETKRPAWEDVSPVRSVEGAIYSKGKRIG